MAYDNNISQILDDIIEHMTDGDITQEEEDELFALIDNIMIPSAKDFIVDTGTEGIWTYRKWNSGRCELSCVNTTNVACNTAYSGTPSNNAYRTDVISVNLPFAVLDAHVNLTGYGIYASGVYFAGTLNDGNILQYYIWLPITDNSRERAVHILVDGRWK